MTPLEEPTDLQRAVVIAPSEQRWLISAGAGTGKTFVLAARLAALIGREGLQPGSELLCLSFSRAAVGEVRRRLAGTGGAAFCSPVATLDSFATQLLAALDPDGTWSSSGFEQRIRDATDILQTSGAQQELARFKHVIIDEVQDVVGVRAKFVIRLLESIECGFTLLGDPSQAIYDFDADQGDEVFDSRKFYAEIRRQFGNRLMESGLGPSMRAKSDETRRVSEIGELLRLPDPDYEAVNEELKTFVLGLMPLGDLAAVLPMFQKPRGSIAILCGTNGEVLTISRRLAELKIEHAIGRSATERPACRWIAAALNGVSAVRVSRATVLSRLPQSANAEMLPEEMWARLKLLDRGRADELDLRRVAERLRLKMIPEDLVEGAGSNVIVSTIHRAKGLEFDRVVLAQNPWSQQPQDKKLGEETRRLFVALSRARLDLYTMSVDGRGLRKSSYPPGRWLRNGTGGQSRQAAEIEVLGSDVHAASPAGTFILEEDAGGLQEFIRTEVRRGDDVVFERVRSDAGNPGCASYAVRHGGRSVGVTTEDFAIQLHRDLGVRDGRWPERIVGLKVDCVDSVAGDESAGRAAGLGPAGIWLRVRVRGMGKPQWT